VRANHEARFNHKAGVNHEARANHEVRANQKAGWHQYRSHPEGSDEDKGSVMEHCENKPAGEIRREGVGWRQRRQNMPATTVVRANQPEKSGERALVGGSDVRICPPPQL
jgi:hypothetical protein